MHKFAKLCSKFLINANLNFIKFTKDLKYLAKVANFHQIWTDCGLFDMFYEIKHRLGLKCSFLLKTDLLPRFMFRSLLSYVVDNFQSN